MFLVAVNNARRNAELLHNFEFARITALLAIDGVNGAAFSAATSFTGYVAGSTFSGIKEVVAVSRQRPDGTWIPLDFARVDIPIERDRTELELSDNLFPYLRYPSDAQIDARGTSSSIVQRGQALFIHPRFNNVPSTTFNVQVEGYGWLQEYQSANSIGLLTLTSGSKNVTGTSGANFSALVHGDILRTQNQTGVVDTVTNATALVLQANATASETAVFFSINGSDVPEDFIVQYGANWLQWAIVCELNMNFRTFVPRTEGNLAPPEKYRDEAWHDLLLWDTYQVDANTTRSK